MIVPVVSLVVMLGRGIDQILAHPVDPQLHEPCVTDARRYVEFAEQASGPIPRPVTLDWPWGASCGSADHHRRHAHRRPPGSSRGHDPSEPSADQR
ncbi:poly-gamma-glutamate capsule biosynthesis protein CapA/YwtB (metallophosphatase superfamily) [Nocardia sp. GAS34]|uniref:hypothetical protein n=1 Tax=unclassified Nocardia TaxID=2637762 RepID=UPI003D221802